MNGLPQKRRPRLAPAERTNPDLCTTSLRGCKCAAPHELVLSNVANICGAARAGALDHQLETRQNDDLDCGTYQARLRLPRSSTIAIAISLRVRETKAGPKRAVTCARMRMRSAHARRVAAAYGSASVRLSEAPSLEN